MHPLADARLLRSPAAPCNRYVDGCNETDANGNTRRNLTAYSNCQPTLSAVVLIGSYMVSTQMNACSAAVQLDVSVPQLFLIPSLCVFCLSV